MNKLHLSSTSQKHVPKFTGYDAIRITFYSHSSQQLSHCKDEIPLLSSIRTDANHTTSQWPLVHINRHRAVIIHHRYQIILMMAVLLQTIWYDDNCFVLLSHISTVFSHNKSLLHSTLSSNYHFSFICIYSFPSTVFIPHLMYPLNPWSSQWSLIHVFISQKSTY